MRILFRSGKSSTFARILQRFGMKHFINKKASPKPLLVFAPLKLWCGMETAPP